MKKLDTGWYKVYIICYICYLVWSLSILINWYDKEILKGMKKFYAFLIVVNILILLGSVIFFALYYLGIISDNGIANKFYKKDDYIVYSELESQGIFSGNVLKYNTGQVLYTKNENVYIKYGASTLIKKYTDIYKNLNKNKKAADKQTKELNDKEEKKEKEKKKK